MGVREGRWRRSLRRLRFIDGGTGLAYEQGTKKQCRTTEARLRAKRILHDRYTAHGTE